MYAINKLVGWLANPFTVAWMGTMVGVLCLALGAKKRRKLVLAGRWLMGLSVAWLWLWSTPMMCRGVGSALEGPYLVNGKVPQVEDLPSADVIELHGGSMGIVTNLAARGEMWTSADRVWMAARIWRAQAHKVKVEGEGEQWKPKLFVTGAGCAESTIGLLEDFGVPTNAIVVANDPRNTEEEAKYIGSLFPAARVLVVTSAWHMTRALLMYEKYAPNVEAVAAPCDFENTVRNSGGFSWRDLLPSDEVLIQNRISLHEWIGIWGYRWFRK